MQHEKLDIEEGDSVMNFGQAMMNDEPMQSNRNLMSAGKEEGEIDYQCYKPQHKEIGDNT